MIKDIEELYEKTMKNKPPESKSEGRKEEEKKDDQRTKSDSKIDSIANMAMPKLDQNEFLAAF
jgi:hypothetical protein